MKDSYNINKNGRENVIEICTNLIKNGIIEDEKELLEYIEMTKKQKKEQDILKQHIEKFYHIWQNNKGVYLTYLPAPDKPKGRKPVSATTQEKLERKVIDFYMSQTDCKKPEEVLTLRKLYPKWLQFKSLETTNTSYIRRIDDDWRRFYLNDPIIDRDIRKFTKVELRTWALSKIREENLTKRRYYSMTVIIRQALNYAVDSDMLPANLFNTFTVDAKLFRKVRKPEDSSQVFLKDERPLIESEAWREFNEIGCTTALTVPLAFQTGLRLGELIALKECDICRNGKYLHIQRMAQREERQRPDGTWYPAKWITVDHGKTSAADRYVYLTEEARRIIDVVIAANQENGFYDNGFLFIHGGKLITPRAVSSRLRRYCANINISTKSAHKIRKSYISTLLDEGVNINEVRKQVGHEDERTTLHNYCFNRNSVNANEAEIEHALAI